MKSKPYKLIFFLFLLLLDAAAYAQPKTDTFDEQKMALYVPHSKSKSPDVLAVYLTAKYDDDAAKAYAISYWIAHRIKYDYKGYKNHRTQQYSSEKVLKKRKALCGEYANLYKEMCEAVGIQALVVEGYAKEFDFLENDTVYSSNHAWNISLIKGEWQLSDHTYASGVLLPRKHLLKQRKPKFYFKRHYDPNWISVPPNRLIQTHFPDLQIFQLLQNPLTVSEFAQGTKKEELMPIAGKNHLIDNYIALPFQEKIIYAIEQGKEVNPFNNRMLGYQHFTLVDDFFKKQYDAETKNLDISIGDLFFIEKHAFFADSLLKLARQDNNASFQQKKRQNQQMRNALKINNRFLADDLQKRFRQNWKNITTSIMLLKNHKNMKKYFKRQNDRFLSRKPLETVKRSALEQSNKNRINELLSQLDSIQNKVIPKQLSQIDSLNAVYTYDNIAQNVLVVQTLTNRYSALLANLKTMEKQHALGVPFLIHKNLYYLEKKDFTNEIYSLDSLKKQHIDTMMFQLRENQKSFYKQVKQYTQSTAACLNILKSIKRESAEQHNEDSYYAKIIAEYVKNLSKLKNYSEKYLISHPEMYPILQKELVRALAVQNKKIGKIISRLKIENKMENYRYLLYDAYLKNRRAGDNIRVKAVEKQLNRYQRAIEKEKKKTEEVK